MTHTPDIYTRVTAKIIADLERGELTWRKPWNAEHLAGRIHRPLRRCFTPYQGINVLLLWAAAVERGFASPHWMTYRQAQELGAQVRKGARGEIVVYAGSLTTEETRFDEGSGQWHSETAERRFLKSYVVFNTEEIDGLPETYAEPPAPPRSDIARDDRLDAFVSATGARIAHGGDRAYYAIADDRVQMPPLETFRDAEAYYATLAHELTHWTRHPTRLDRDFKRKAWGDEGYAREELVAEIGSAFLCAELGITPEVREDHAAYIEGWLEVLRGDKRAVFQAASVAQAAADYLLACSADTAQAA